MNRTSFIKSQSKILKPKEKELQKLFYNRVRTKQLYNFYPSQFFIYHTPNEQMCSKAYTMELKRMGLRGGIPDITILRPLSPPAWIEFKRNGKCKVSEAQQAFRTLCEGYNYPYLLTWDIDEAEEWLISLL